MKEIRARWASLQKYAEPGPYGIGIVVTREDDTKEENKNLTKGVQK